MNRPGEPNAVRSRGVLASRALFVCVALFVVSLVFGVSFQTPLVMFFLNRIGMFTAEMYWRKWRYAVFVIAVFSAVITPTPDAVTMLYLFVPMFGLYVFGVLVCYYFPPHWQTHPVVIDETQIAV